MWLAPFYKLSLTCWQRENESTVTVSGQAQYFGLDTSSVKVEKVPLVIAPVREVALTRVK